ncbi:MAG TPA: DUF692 domain-containing protein [Bdellovibrionales bacterium]|nr:DUF692 domain-containing protein [Bdellovibrionales bacterium]
MPAGLIGVGLRPAHYPYLEPRLKDESSAISSDWFEAISENYMDTEGRPLEMLLKVRSRFDVALHGVSLSIGSTDELNYDYLSKLKRLAERLEPMIVSDHLCWTGAHGRNYHDLLPLPYTTEAVSHVTTRIEAVQEYLGRKIVLENVSAYVSFNESEMTEWEFLNEISRRSGAGILLDLNNVYVNSRNHGYDPYEFIDKIDLAAVEQIHLAGFTDMGEFLFDTHSKPVYEPVWQLFARFAEKKPEVPILIEWDEDIPAFEVLAGEAEKARAIVRDSRRPRLVRSEP